MLAALLGAAAATGTACGALYSIVSLLLTSPPLAVITYVVGRRAGWTPFAAIGLSVIVVATQQISFLVGVAIRLAVRMGRRGWSVHTGRRQATIFDRRM